MDAELLDTPDTLASLLDLLKIKSQTIPPMRIFIDLEGNNLSRNGTLSLITILVEGEQQVYLIDVTTLKAAAFSTRATNHPVTMKTVFESQAFIKVFFDVRNDSDALFSLYGVELGNVEDLQLMELASRSFSRRCVNGLAKCIERDSTIGYHDQRNWQKIKARGRQLFDPKNGGSFDVFDRRPLATDLTEYCAQDVQYMPHLYHLYKAKLCDAWWLKIREETDVRIRLSQSASFNGKGRHMAEGPRHWISWQPSLIQRQTRTLLDAPSIGGDADPVVSTDNEPRALVDDAENVARSLQQLNLAGALSTLL